jgi:hypothetical protein
VDSPVLEGCDEALRERFFRNVEAEVVEPPDWGRGSRGTEGCVTFRHSIDIKAAIAAGAFAPWTSVGATVSENMSGDVCTLRTSIRSGRFTVAPLPR